MRALDRYQDLIVQYSMEFTEIIHSGDIAAAVPSCPGWSMTDLALHLSGTQRWSTQIVLSGVRGEHPVGPADRDGLERWFVEGAEQLVLALRESDPDAPTWTFGPQPRLISFWSRRMAHEVAVHLWDAKASQGLAFDIDAELAADGIDEVCTVFLPMRLKQGAIPQLEQSLLLEPTDSPGASFLLTARQPDAQPGPQVTLRGPAGDLLLALWGRIAIDGLEIEGDEALAREFLLAGATA